MKKMHKNESVRKEPMKTLIAVLIIAALTVYGLVVVHGKAERYFNSRSHIASGIK
jgi:hypothetical protein